MRVPLETFLHLQRQAVHAATHVRVPGGDPDPHVRGHRDHRRAFNVAATRDAGAAAVTFTRTPSASSTTITGPSARFGARSGASASTAGTKDGAVGAVSAARRQR